MDLTLELGRPAREYIQSNESERALVPSAVKANVDPIHEALIDSELESQLYARLRVSVSARTDNVGDTNGALKIENRRRFQAPLWCEDMQELAAEFEAARNGSWGRARSTAVAVVRICRALGATKSASTGNRSAGRGQNELPSGRPAFN